LLLFFDNLAMATTLFTMLPTSASGIAPSGHFRGSSPMLATAGLSSFRSRGSAAGGILTVRCKAEDTPQGVEPKSAVKLPEASRNPNPPTAPEPKGTSFWEALAFSGPAPERINGRLAMIGFVSAVAVEAARGQDLATQLANGGVLWFAGAAALFSVASLVPLFRGVDALERSTGPMTADAELWNGRFAMLGLVGLAFTEFIKGGPLV
ncbi:chlorophyll a-b binding domain-containing protein, partial [Campylobacter coli]|uniref:chlorophyll a-b binding domain-containing protein n=1 Tax=Campylobacter coli TaxID=195 RepID=UPI001E36362F